MFCIVYCIFCIVCIVYCIFCIVCNGLLYILHCLAMVYCIFCIVLQWFITYFALSCNGLLHILHRLAMVYRIFCFFLQWFIAYFALQVVAGVMRREEEWEIEDADEVKAATALLPFTRPGKKLFVSLHHSTPTQALHQLAATIKQTAFGGELVMGLEHSHDNFITCDVKDLHGAK